MLPALGEALVAQEEPPSSRQAEISPIPLPLGCHLFNNVLEWNPNATERQRLHPSKASWSHRTLR